MVFIWWVQQQISKMTPNPRRLITISTGDGRWHGKWDSEYLLSLQDLRLNDLIDDEHQKNAQVSVKLCVQKVTPLSLLFSGTRTMYKVKKVKEEKTKKKKERKHYVSFFVFPMAFFFNRNFV